MGIIEKLPNELLEHILYNVDQETLRLKCIDVSQKWRNIVQSVQFWKRYHRYWYSPRISNPSPYPFLKGPSSYIPEDMFRGDYDWTLFSYINPQENPFQRNLLRNSDGNQVSAEEIQLQENRYFEGEYMFRPRTTVN